MKWSLGTVLGAVAAVVLASPAFAAVDAFLRIDGIPGESQDSHYPGSIELQSWSFHGGGAAPTSVRTPGGSPSFREIVITKSRDQTSPILMKACATGAHYKTATLFMRKAGGTQTYLQYRMSDVMLSGYSVGSGGDRPTESLTINFAKIEIIDQSPTQTGAQTGMVPRATHLPPPGQTP